VQWAVIDIDGVLADVRHRVHFVERSPKDWESFFAAAINDEPLAEGIAAVHEQLSLGRSVVYVSGRPERCRRDTEQWLERQGLPTTPLHLRRNSDRRPARLTKKQIIESLAQRGEVAVVIDDDAAVVATLREAGFNVLHATWMDGGTNGVDSSPVQEALFEAQESDGRT
jgi:hypothetical protein